MILSEKELEQLIRSVPSIGPYHAGAGEAARLVAERMQAGVFYEADVMNGADGRPWIDSNEANVGLTIACKKHLKEGEMFRVTFTKLEECDDTE